MASTGTITFPTAAALVLGENIGTTITALLAGIGTNTSAKRAALSHAIFNICGVAILCVFFQPYLKLVDWVVPGVPDLVSADGSKDLISAHIAMGHTLFNVTATLIALPVLGYLAQLVEFLVPAKDEPEEHHLQYIGSAGNSNSAVALSMAELELQNMIKIVAEIFDESDRYLRTKSHDQALLDSLSRHEKITDNINEEITSFCCRVIEGGLTAEQSVRAYTIIRAASELESLADYCHSIASYRHRLYRNKLDFSEKAWEEITTFFSQVHEFFSTVSASLNELEPQLISKWNQHAIALNKDADILRDGHIARMRKGSCKPLPAITFSDLAVAMRRVKNHTVNLYEALGYHTIDIEANQD